VVLGAWTFMAPWVIRGGVNTTLAVINNVTIGAVCFVLGLQPSIEGATA
jgi:hypothetical protein